MKKSTVWLADFRCSDDENLLQKFTRLLDKAGLGRLPLENAFTAIKIHFGEDGNMSYLRPDWARVLVSYIRNHGGRPFLTDANTLYTGSRANALDHLEIAYAHGFSPFSTECHVIIADGLRGTDDVTVPLPNGHYVKEAYIARAIADADVMVTLTHFKCHEMTGIGGAIKNLGMGCASRAGKKAMHSPIHPEVEEAACIGCGRCVRECAHSALSIKHSHAMLDSMRCVGCGRCIGACSRGAISTDFGQACTEMQGRIAEYAAAACLGKPCFHISFVCDVSPHCDCHGMNDAPIVADVGILASADPVALDCACADLCNASTVMPGSALDGVEINGDVFTAMHPETRWHEAVDEAARMRLGLTEYILKRI